MMMNMTEWMTEGVNFSLCVADGGTDCIFTVGFYLRTMFVRWRLHLILTLSRNLGKVRWPYTTFIQHIYENLQTPCIYSKKCILLCAIMMKSFVRTVLRSIVYAYEKSCSSKSTNFILNLYPFHVWIHCNFVYFCCLN